MGKHEDIAARVAALGRADGSPHHPCYLEYFRLFNAQSYYAAHDMLEHVWIGSRGERHAYYKALIQFAGGFVHLQHHHRDALHRIHGRRLRPASRLFLRSAELLAAFPPTYEGASVADIRAMALATAGDLAAGGFERNPWSPERAPRLLLPA